MICYFSTKLYNLIIFSFSSSSSLPSSPSPSPLQWTQRCGVIGIAWLSRWWMICGYDDDDDGVHFNSSLFLPPEWLNPEDEMRCWWWATDSLMMHWITKSIEFSQTINRIVQTNQQKDQWEYEDHDDDDHRDCNESTNNK